MTKETDLPRGGGQSSQNSPFVVGRQESQLSSSPFSRAYLNLDQWIIALLDLSTGIETNGFALEAVYQT